MKSSSPGIIDSVTGFFKESFTKEESKPAMSYESKSFLKNKETKYCKEQLRGIALIHYRNAKFRVMNKRSQSSIDLFSQQSIEGFWKDLSLIGELFDKTVE